MRAILLTPMLVAFACASADQASTIVDAGWQGPPVTASNATNGDLEVVVTVGTGGHGLVVQEVERSGEVADVRLQLQMPTGDLVTQVITELPVVIPAKDLGDVGEARIWLAQGDGESSLALAVER